MYSEKEHIYSLMKELIIERREITKQYYDLKQSLTKLDSIENLSAKESVEISTSSLAHVPPLVHTEQISSTNFQRKKTYSFERIASCITEILKESPIPLSNKKIYDKLLDEYEIFITLTNFSNNILPKIHQTKQIPVEKAYRGFWQYTKSERE